MEPRDTTSIGSWADADCQDTAKIEINKNKPNAHWRTTLKIRTTYILVKIIIYIYNITDNEEKN